MKSKNNLGIWMNHSIARLIKVDSNDYSSSIESKYSNTTKRVINRSENVMHNKERQIHETYYKKIGNEILKYDHVVLFGPTKAKSELYNLLSKDSHFKDIKIDVETTDSISASDQHDFVDRYFRK